MILNHNRCAKRELFSGLVSLNLEQPQARGTYRTTPENFNFSPPLPRRRVAVPSLRGRAPPHPRHPRLLAAVGAVPDGPPAGRLHVHEPQEPGPPRHGHRGHRFRVGGAGVQGAGEPQHLAVPAADRLGLGVPCQRIGRGQADAVEGRSTRGVFSSSEVYPPPCWSCPPATTACTGEPPDAVQLKRYPDAGFRRVRVSLSLVHENEWLPPVACFQRKLRVSSYVFFCFRRRKGRWERSRKGRNAGRGCIDYVLLYRVLTASLSPKLTATGRVS